MIRAATTTETSPHRDAALDDAYCSLVHRLRQDSAGDAGLVVGVTSSSRGEGVTTVCANLAISAARMFGQPSLVIDTCFKSPGSHEVFDATRTMGLADILCGAATPECIQSTSFDNVSLIAAGSNSNRRNTVISAAALKVLIDGLKQRFQFIFVDLPPVTESAESLTIGAVLPGVMLVVEAETVRNQVVNRAKDALLASDANLLGAVFNKRQKHVPDWLYRRL